MKDHEPSQMIKNHDKSLSTITNHYQLSQIITIHHKPLQTTTKQHILLTLR